MANEINITMTAKDLASGKIKGVGDQAKTSMDKLRGMRGSFLAVGAAGAAVVGALGLAIKTFAQTGDEIQKMSLRTALSTEVLSEYKFALEQSGSTIEGFEKSIRRMSSFVLDGHDGLTTTTDALDRLGISVQDLEGLGVEDAFVLLSSALANVEDDITQAALAQDLFGRSGTAMLPLLAQGADGIAALREEARELGIVFDQDMANAAARVIDAQNTMRKSTLGLQMAFAQHLAPALSSTLETMGKVISKVTAFAKDNPVLTATIGALAAVFGLLAIGVAAVGLALPLAAIAFGALGIGVSGATLAFVGFNLATGGILLAIGLVVAGIVALIMNWDAVVRAVKIGANFLIGIIEGMVNIWLFQFNILIKAFNKVAGIFGKQINELEVTIPRIGIALEETAEVVEEASDQMGTSLEDVRSDFTETADVAEDAYKKMTMSASEWNKKKIAGYIEASKSEEAMFQRKRQRDEKIAQWEDKQAAESLARAMEEAEALVATSNERYAKQKELRWQNVEDEALANEESAANEKAANEESAANEKAASEESVANAKKEADEKEKIRRQQFEDGIALLEAELQAEFEAAELKRKGAELLADENKKAFQTLYQSVMRLPSIMPSNLGIGIDTSDVGIATAMRVLKSRGADATSVGGGQFEATGVTGERTSFTFNVWGDIYGEDTEDMVNEAVKQGAQRGMWDTER